MMQSICRTLFFTYLCYNLAVEYGWNGLHLPLQNNELVYSIVYILLSANSHFKLFVFEGLKILFHGWVSIVARRLSRIPRVYNRLYVLHDMIVGYGIPILYESVERFFLVFTHGLVQFLILILYSLFEVRILYSAFQFNYIYARQLHPWIFSFYQYSHYMYAILYAYEFAHFVLGLSFKYGRWLVWGVNTYRSHKGSLALRQRMVPLRKGTE
jgi:hypothetical protein